MTMSTTETYRCCEKRPTACELLFLMSCPLSVSVLNIHFLQFFKFHIDLPTFGNSLSTKVAELAPFEVSACTSMHCQQLQRGMGRCRCRLSTAVFGACVCLGRRRAEGVWVKWPSDWLGYSSAVAFVIGSLNPSSEKKKMYGGRAREQITIYVLQGILEDTLQLHFTAQRSLRSGSFPWAAHAVNGHASRS